MPMNPQKIKISVRKRNVLCLRTHAYWGNERVRTQGCACQYSCLTHWMHLGHNSLHSLGYFDFG
jgi:hypothetical protein